MVTTFSPTMAPTGLTPTPSTLVLGMGVGTFIVAFFAVVLAFVFCLSSPCDFERKLLWRIVSTIMFGIVFFVLLFAPRTDIYQSTETLTQVWTTVIHWFHLQSILFCFKIIQYFTSTFVIEYIIDIRWINRSSNRRVHHRRSVFNRRCRAVVQSQQRTHRSELF